jgi:hypothetical protein
VVPGSNKAAPSSIAVHGAKGGKKRRKWHPQGVAVVADYDDDDDKKTEDSDMEYIATAGSSVKCQALPPIDHFERLLEEACPNHAYLIKDKLKDYGTMKNFMTSGSHTQDKELDEDLGESDSTPFNEENAVMMVYGGRPLLRGAVCLT